MKEPVHPDIIARLPFKLDLEIQAKRSQQIIGLLPEFCILFVPILFQELDQKRDWAGVFVLYRVDASQIPALLDLCQENNLVLRLKPGESNNEFHQIQEPEHVLNMPHKHAVPRHIQFRRIAVRQFMHGPRLFLKFQIFEISSLVKALQKKALVKALQVSETL